MTGFESAMEFDLILSLRLRPGFSVICLVKRFVSYKEKVQIEPKLVYVSQETGLT